MYSRQRLQIYYVPKIILRSCNVLRVTPGTGFTFPILCHLKKAIDFGQDRTDDRKITRRQRCRWFTGVSRGEDSILADADGFSEDSTVGQVCRKSLHWQNCKVEENEEEEEGE